MIINGKEVEKKEMVKGTRQKGQFQPAGVDLSLQSVWRFDGMGVIDGDNSKRKIPGCQKIEWRNDESIELEAGAYKIIFNEIVSIPKNAAAIARSRSSLLRCGGSVQTAVWDPGYEGRSEALLLISNPAGIRIYKNAKVVQLIFIKLEKEAGEIYKGKYQGENL